MGALWASDDGARVTSRKSDIDPTPCAQLTTKWRATLARQSLIQQMLYAQWLACHHTGCCPAIGTRKFLAPPEKGRPETGTFSQLQPRIGTHFYACVVV